MSEKGVFAVARSIWEDEDFADEPFTERQAMIWLVSSAAWKDGAVRMNSVPVKVFRGEFCFAERFLAEKWGWTKARVHRFLKRLENRGSVRTAKRSGSTVYSLTKYNDFQVLWLPREPQSEPSSEPSPNQVRTKEEKHLKQENKDSSKELSMDLRASLLSPPLDADTAREVIAFREKRKQSTSKIALTRLANQFSKYESPNEGAAEMIVRGWKGFNPEWMQDIPRQGTGPPRSTREERFRSVVAEHLEEIDRANIVELRPIRRAICGPDSERSSGELHAAAAGYENHAAPAYDPLHGKAEGSFEEDGSP